MKSILGRKVVTIAAARIMPATTLAAKPRAVTTVEERPFEGRVMDFKIEGP